jgi:hypothetical protein
MALAFKEKIAFLQLKNIGIKNLIGIKDLYKNLPEFYFKSGSKRACFTGIKTGG